jgi:hypothetical protein
MSMTRNKIILSRRLALKFVKACDDALARLDRENSQRGAWNPATESYEEAPRPAAPHDTSGGSPETAALRRHSMDLTRSLAELRRRA